jgi:endoglucanase
MKALSRKRLAAVLLRSEPKLRSKANNHFGDIYMRNTTLRLKLAACAVAVFISACGGGDASAPASGGRASIGFVIDGYLRGATVLCDTNNNGVADTGERTTTTDSSGFFRFSDACTSALVATGGTSIDTNLPFIGTLRAPAGATVITPLTSLIAFGMSQSKVNEVMGLPIGTDLLMTDPARTLTGSSTLEHPDLMKRTLVVQQYAQKITEAIAGLATSGGDAARTAIYSEVMTALAQALAANPALVTGSTISETVTQALVKAAAQRVAASTTLAAAVKAGVSALNADSLAQVMAGALKAQGETILGASGDALTAKTKAAQESTAITSFVQMNKANSALTGAPTAATAVLATTLKSGTTPAPVATNLVANGNFSNGITGWSGNARDVRTEGGNSFNFAEVATAGQPFAVNLSYVLNIPTSGVAYKLRFKASSNRNRTMLAGIGLNEGEFTNASGLVNLTTAQQTFELSLTSNFASANSRVFFDMGADTGVVVIDDVELVLDTSTPPPAVGGPTAAASAPTAMAANVRSIFSDSYTNVTGTTFGPDFGPFSSRITDGVIASNNFKTMDVTAGKTFGAVSFVPSKFNATAFTTFHMDYWIDTPVPVGQVLSIKLSNHDGAGETSAIQTTVVNITGGGWQRISIPLNDFTQAANSLSRNNIAEIIITAARADTGVPVKVHFDNMYFSQ